MLQHQTQPAETGSAPRKIRERSEKIETAPPAPRQPPAAEPPAPAAKPAVALTREMESLAAKLNIAARDLIEAADGGLPPDLERKYENGERDIYTRRLFEGRGKRLQRNIADQYGSDRRVRNRVDAYVRVFERLLDMMSNANRGEALVEACLASEQGRIYVMLAEAAGRIPPQK